MTQLMMMRGDGVEIECDPRLNLNHWYKGGTAITNFRPSDLPMYLKAISEHGSNDYVVATRPITGKSSPPSGYSLHCLSIHDKEHEGSSGFWNTYRVCNGLAH